MKLNIYHNKFIQLFLTVTLLMQPVLAKEIPGNLKTSELNDRNFLQKLLENTWISLDAMIDASTGLPRDTQKPGGHTNTTNIGLYLASLCVANEIGLINPSNGFKRAEKIIRTLETFKRKHGFMPNFIPVNLSDKTSHGIMAISDFNKLAVGLIMTRQTWPKLSNRINAFLNEIEWGKLYDTKTGFTYWGFDLDKKKPHGKSRLMLTADTRLATFMLIATKAAPASIWENLTRDPKETSVGRICAPGYEFGAIFMHAMDGLFIHELDTEVGESVANLAWHQILFAKKRGYPVWGWSNCFIPKSGYTEGGFVPERVVAPYASALVIEYYPKKVTKVLRELVRRGGTIPPKGYEGKNWGLRDSYDLDNDTWDDKYLTLDQGMIFLSLANYLHKEIVRKIYTSDPLIRRGLKLLKPYIKHDSSQLKDWKKRDKTPAGKIVSNNFKVTNIPLTKNHSNSPEFLKLSPTNSNSVIISLDNKGNENEFVSTFSFEPLDISALNRIEIDLEILKASSKPVGHLRLYISDKFGQRRYSHFKLDREKKTYTISSKELYGILLDEEAVQNIQFSFWRSPWYYTQNRIQTDSCELKLNAIRFISQN